jgi:hypothetical protein
MIAGLVVFCIGLVTGFVGGVNLAACMVEGHHWTESRGRQRDK